MGDRHGAGVMWDGGDRECVCGSAVEKHITIFL